MNQARKDIVRSSAASAPRILVVEDESDLALLLAFTISGRRAMWSRAWSAATKPNSGWPRIPRPCHPRLDAAWRVGPRDLPEAEGAREYAHPSGHHGYRARRGSRARARPFGRRGRLRGQAVLGAGADGAGSRAAAPQPSLRIANRLNAGDLNLNCRAWKGCSNPLLLSALLFAPESRPPPRPR